MPTPYTRLENALKRLLDKDQRRDLARYGADAGWPGLTYYRDTARFYQRHKEAIWELAIAQSEEAGYSNPFEFLASFNTAGGVSDVYTFENLMTWYAAEEVCRRLSGDY